MLGEYCKRRYLRAVKSSRIKQWHIRVVKSSRTCHLILSDCPTIIIFTDIKFPRTLGPARYARKYVLRKKNYSTTEGAGGIMYFTDPYHPLDNPYDPYDNN